jgi:predicted phage terminase large subunit-like protein
MAGEAGFLSFAAKVLASAGQVPARHHRLLIEHLEDVATGSCDRLMVQMPPGSAKSTYGSVLFPAYFFGVHAQGQIIGTAHTASLADYFGRHVRDLIAAHGDLLGLRLTKSSRAAGQFFLESGAEYFAAGVAGPITGRRADLIIIDDPVKSWAEAESAHLRDGLYDWYRAELSARLKPRGRIVLIMTRWHEDDLAARLLRGDAGWKVVKLPALAEANDPLGRLPGGALWPEWQDEAAIARRRQEVGERAFAAIYQQNPRPPEMALFNTKMIRILPEAPVLVRVIRAWDLAASLAETGRNPDYTVGLKAGTTEDQRVVILDVIRMQASSSQVEARIVSTAKADGTATIVALPQDPGQAGIAQISTLSQRLLGYHVHASPERGTKVMRAGPAATQVDAANLYLLAAPWNESFIAELAAFPDSEKDDQVDALSRAVNTLATTGAMARRLSVPLLAR